MISMTMLGRACVMSTVPAPRQNGARPVAEQVTVQVLLFGRDPVESGDHPGPVQLFCVGSLVQLISATEGSC
jgi:hypothetical protein